MSVCFQLFSGLGVDAVPLQDFQASGPVQGGIRLVQVQEDQNSILNCILFHLYWILILDIFKFVRCSTAILPLDADFPPFSCIFLRLVTLLVMTNASCYNFLHTVGSCVHYGLNQ